jgi:hypothetical protein
MIILLPGFTGRVRSVVEGTKIFGLGTQIGWRSVAVDQDAVATFFVRTVSQDPGAGPWGELEDQQ